MNAAFLLVATAWLAGEPAADDAKDAAKPAASACCECCDSGHGFGQRLRDCLRRLCHRDDCCEPCPAPKCEPKCCEVKCCQVRCCQPRCERACRPSCDNGCGGHRLFGHRNRCDSCCETKCTTTCTTCCDPCGGGGHFLGRLRGLFHRNDCDCCGGTSNGEPQKMPEGEGKDVRVITPPARSNAAAPAVESIPAVPSIDADDKNPF